MQIDISQTTETIIQRELAEGVFSSPADVIDAMANHWKHTRGRRGALPADVDIDALAEAQAVGPIVSCDELFADFWPADEDPDEFLSEIRELRQLEPSPEIP